MSGALPHCWWSPLCLGRWGTGSIPACPSGQSNSIPVLLAQKSTFTGSVVGQKLGNILFQQWRGRWQPDWADLGQHWVPHPLQPCRPHTHDRGRGHRAGDRHQASQVIILVIFGMLMQRGRSMRWSETDLFYGLKLNMKFEPYASGAESGSGS